MHHIPKKRIFAAETDEIVKNFYTIALAIALCFSSLSLYSQAERDGIEVSMSGITLSITASNVHITGANGEVMEIFNLTGTKVYAVRIDSNDKSFSLNLSKGCYLVKVGKIVRKISTP